MMTAAGGLAINGKFLSAQPTGVHRVAHELLGAIEDYREEIEHLAGGPTMVLVPRDAHLPTRAGFTIDARSVLVGQPWEQFELPIRAGRRLLLSLCNLSPVASPHSITMIHDAQTFITPASYSAAFRYFYRTIQPVIGHRAIRTLTVSDFSARELARYHVAPPERIRVIPNGVDHILRDAPDPAVIDRLGLKGGRYVLALSSTQAHKNIQVLLRTFETTQCADLRLVLFGSTSRADMVRAGLTVPEGVMFAGRVSDGEVRALMERALCFAMPSLTEGFGLPPLEAMLLGCPAVIAPCGALPDLCADAAVYADEHDPAQWGTAFRRLADDPSFRAGYADAGQRRARLFTWQRAGAALMDVLREVVANVR